MPLDQLPPAPIQTPVLTGVSLDSVENQDRGALTLGWVVWLQTLQQLVNALNNTASIVSDTISLTSSTTAIPDPGAGSVDNVIILYVQTDATDGRQITWGSTYKGVTANDIVNYANWTNVYMFQYRADGNWWLTTRSNYAS
jgi:hypothetical protein